MKDSEVKIGGLYTAKVSDKLTTVRIDSKHSRKGWNATNTKTGKKIHIKSGQRLRAEAKGASTTKAKATAAKKPTPKAAAPKKPVKPYDPDKCATPRCKGEVHLTHLGKPLCQKCWEKQCNEVVAEVAAEAPVADKADVAPASDVTTDTPAPAKKPRSKKPTAEPKPKRMSILDAAAAILADAEAPMRAKEIVEMMAARGLWTSPNGKTPEATLYSGMIREIAARIDKSRFRKVERGTFMFNVVAEE